MRDRIYRFQITGESDPFGTSDTCRAWDPAFERSVFLGRTRVSAGDRFERLSEELSAIVGDDIELFSEGDYLYVVSTREEALAPAIEKLRARGFAVATVSTQAVSAPEAEPIPSPRTVSAPAGPIQRERAIDPPGPTSTPLDKPPQWDLKNVFAGVFFFLASAAAVIVIGVWLRPSAPRSPVSLARPDGQVRQIDQPGQPPRAANPTPAPIVKPGGPTRSYAQANIDQPSQRLRDTTDRKPAPNEDSRARTRSDERIHSGSGYPNLVTKNADRNAVAPLPTPPNDSVDASRAAAKRDTTTAQQREARQPRHVDEISGPTAPGPLRTGTGTGSGEETPVPSPRGDGGTHVTPPVQQVPDDRPIAPATVPSEPNVTRPPARAFPKEGTLVWSGHVEKDEQIRISRAGASSGTLAGDRFPGPPIQISLNSKVFSVVTTPSPLNQFSEVVVQSATKGNIVLTIHWTVLFNNSK